MADIDTAIGYVVARGDAVERARLSYLRTGKFPAAEIYDNLEAGQTPTGGWPPQWGAGVASVDATCFRLAELDDLGGLSRPSAKRALDWLASRQRLDGFWEEDASLEAVAPPWAKPGDPEARFYLTVNATFWLAVAAEDAAASRPTTSLDSATTSLDSDSPDLYEVALTRAGQAIRDSLDENGAWPGFLVSGWLAGAVLQRAEWFYEAARIFMILGDRVKTMSAADAAWMVAALLRIGVNVDDSIISAGRRQLSATQRPDGAWPSDDGPQFDVNTTLTALRALR
jgi:hypothetical protein